MEAMEVVIVAAMDGGRRTTKNPRILTRDKIARVRVAV